ncbi:MAG: PadR family transcriptional regulator [Thermoleophilia bacterium]
MTAIAITTFEGHRLGRCGPRFMTGHRRRRRGPWGPGGPGGFGLGPGAFGPGRRMGRGDIRAAIVALLAEEPMHGYQIMRELAERTGGVWRPSPGSVYPTLQQLEDEGLVEAAAGDGKRVFQLTEAGRAEAAAAGPAPWEAVRDEADEPLVALRDLAMQVLAATRQVAHAGTDEQVRRAQETLRATRRSLYGILAEDDAGDDASPAGS